MMDNLNPSANLAIQPLEWQQSMNSTFSMDGGYQILTTVSLGTPQVTLTYGAFHVSLGAFYGEESDRKAKAAANTHRRELIAAAMNSGAQ